MSKKILIKRIITQLLNPNIYPKKYERVLRLINDLLRFGQTELIREKHCVELKSGK